MPKIIEFHDEQFGTIYVEVEETGKQKEGGFRKISRSSGKIFEKREGKLNNVLESLQTFGKGVLATVEDLKPHEVEVKAGLKFELKEGKLVGIFAQAKAEFPFEVTLKWKFDNNNEKQTT